MPLQTILTKYLRLRYPIIAAPLVAARHLRFWARWRAKVASAS
jgi:hypothetical protein